MPNKPMLTTPLQYHPWTRVSWISGGSDMDDLDEEEVQEVESITLGRAFRNNHSNAVSPTVVSPGSTDSNDDNGDVGATTVPSVTLKPFSFESSGDDSENTSVLLAPFATVEPIHKSNQTGSMVNRAAISFGLLQPTQDGDTLVFPKGDLITPAAADAVAEDDTTTTPPKCSSWKSLWAGVNNEQREEDYDDDDDVKTMETQEETNGQWSENQAVVVEQEDEETELGILASTQERLGCCWASTKRMAKGFFHWVLDGLVFLCTKWVSFVIQYKTCVENGTIAAMNFTQSSATHLVTLWETRVATTLGAAAGPVMCGLGLGVVAVACWMPTKRIPSPTNDLREFVRFEKAHNVVDFKVIDELNTEAFRTYARSTCVEAATFDQARNALDVGLFGVPDGVRSTIVQMAILEGVTQKNSVQDSNSDFVNSGKADAFMAFWSTVYDPSDPLETYKSCVMVTGVALTVAETVAEWTTKREKYQIGTEPCQCGFVYCEECPIFDVREVKWPIFERRSLSLKKQEELRHWMVDQAVKSAEHLVLDGSDRLTIGSSSSVVQSPSFAWTGKTSSSFFGEESHRDRAYRSSSSVDEDFYTATDRDL